MKTLKQSGCSSIRYSITKKISNNTIVTVKFGIYDDCQNGYNKFEFNCILWATNGDRNYGINEYHENKSYYFVEDITTPENIVKYFPQLITVFKLRGCDSFGVETYPLLNGSYHLVKNINYAPKFYRISKSLTNKIAKYNNKLLADFVLNLTHTTYKKDVDKAIKEIESASGEKYYRQENVSPMLYNDIHYTFITDKKGWNVFKGNSDKIKRYPNY